MPDRRQRLNMDDAEADSPHYLSRESLPDGEATVISSSRIRDAKRFDASHGAENSAPRGGKGVVR